MTTFTIKNGKKFSKTNFENITELFVFLRKELMPLNLYFVDEEDIPEKSLEKIKKSQQNPRKNLTNFQG